VSCEREIVSCIKIVQELEDKSIIDKKDIKIPSSRNIPIVDETPHAQHMKSAHRGVKYNCEQCEYKATTKSTLLRHVRSVHEGVKFNCEQCEYKTTWKTELQQHKI